MNNQLQKTLTIFLGVATLLLILGIVFVGVAIRNTADDGSDDSSITMSATGKVTAKPDTANISFSVVVQADTADAAQKQSDETMEKVLEFIKSNEVTEEDIKTSSYNLFPRYNFRVAEDDPTRIIGYTLNQRVTITVRDLDKVPSIVGGLTLAGANQIETVKFFIDDTDELKAQAREEAVRKAKEKAETLAKQLDVKLGDVIDFFESDSSGPIILTREALAIGFSEAADSPIEAGTEDIIVNVTITYKLK